MNLPDLTLSELSQAMQSGHVSSVDIVEACFRRIDEFDNAIGSFVSVGRESAFEQARRLDRERMANRRRGSLHGVPLGMKDNIDVAGLPTTANSRAFANRLPDQNATVVDRLIDNGAIIIGKLGTFELAVGGPTPDLPWPLPRNPWNLTRSPGGSSSGAGAALAARFIPGALGTDTGGSIRSPASLCGLSGLVPSSGLVSRHGIIPTSFTFDHCGPMARTAEDCALLLDAIVGQDPNDPASVSSPPPRFHANLKSDLKGLRIGVVRHFWERSANAAVGKAMEDALEALKSLGATLEDTHFQPIANLAQLRWIIAQSETFNIHLKALQENPGQFGHDFLQRVLPVCLFSGYEYIQALREWGKAIRIMPSALENYDVLISAALEGAPRLDEHDTLQFLKCNGRFLQTVTPTGPSAVFCNGFDAEGLPLGMEVLGRPFDDATLLSVGHAYQSVTSWHRRQPHLTEGLMAPPVVQAARANPTELRVDATIQRLCHTAAERAGLRLNDTQMQLLYQGAPFVLDMTRHLNYDGSLNDAPPTIYRLQAE